ncbi:hypothetical protein HN371_11815 [Candidatus Poribacteria bacterium]|nr:hypothetical protein [Candidatus Poribacteria bacterium]MBT7099100.1 hypothetical protein [Candidatus Poribacteria bacterium]MBT7804320.1 hypothetical protein [Candidatus Poribacteria bacterium]
MWIATDKGVSRLVRATGAWSHYTQDDGLGSDDVRDVAADESTVWVGTSAGVSVYNLQAGTWRTLRERDGLRSDTVSRIALDGEYVWVGTEWNGVSRYNRRTESWEVRTHSDGLSHEGVTAFAVDRESVWIGTYVGVNRYDKVTDSWNVYQHQDGLVRGPTRAIAISDSLVWLGSEYGGVSVYDEVNRAFVQTYTESDLLSSDDIRAFLIDGSSVWIGTANGGAQRYIRAVDSWIQYTTDDGLAGNHVSAIAAYGDEVWLGTWDNGVSVYDKVRNSWTHYGVVEFAPEEDVRDIAEDAAGAAWLATPRGLYRYDPTPDSWTRFGKREGLPTEYITAVEAADGALWIGSSRGLVEARPLNGGVDLAIDAVFPELGYVTALAHAHDTLHVGTADGVFTHDSEGDYHIVQRTAGRPVRCLAAGDDGILLGTDDGAYSLDPQYGPAKPIWTGGSVNAAAWMGGVAWLGTDAGVVRVDAVSKVASTVHGSPTHVASVVPSADGETLWVGSPSGLTSVHTSTLVVTSDSADRRAVLSVATRAAGGTWVGTTAGLTERAPSGASKRHDARVVRDPLIQDGAAHIEYDGDYIWFSNWSESPNGAIVRRDRRDGTWRRFTREAILGATDVRAPTEVNRVVASKGRVWFATDYGVLRYDHLSDGWRHYTAADGLHSDDVRTLAVSDNAVWAASELSTWVSQLDLRTDQWSHRRPSQLIHPRDHAGGATDHIYEMAADGDTVWLTLTASGVRRLSEDGLEAVYTKEDGLAQTGSWWIAAEGERVWVGHRNGRGAGALSMYDNAANVWTVYSTGDMLEHDSVRKVVVGEKYVWVLYDEWKGGSITGYHRGAGEWLTIRGAIDGPEQVTEVWEDGAHLWLAAGQQGVYRYHLGAGTWMHFSSEGTKRSLPADFVNERGIGGDASDVWVATSAGVARYEKDSESWTTFQSRAHLDGEEVRALAVDERYVWVGTDRDTSRYDKRYGVWNRTRLGRRNSLGGATALAVDPRYLWMGTAGKGLGRYDKITDRWFVWGAEDGLVGDKVRAIAVDETNVWIGAAGGVGKLTRLSDTFTGWVNYTSAMSLTADELTREYSESLVSNDVWSLAVQGDKVWVGTRHGASQYHDRRDVWRAFTTSDGLPDNEITAVCVDGADTYFAHNAGVSVYHTGLDAWDHYANLGEGPLVGEHISTAVAGPDAIWFGTLDAGVMRLDKAARKWTQLGVAEGLPHRSVLSLAMDGLQLWVGTHRGLARYDTRTDGIVVFMPYGDSEDLQRMVRTTTMEEVRRDGSAPESPGGR